MLQLISHQLWGAGMRWRLEGTVVLGAPLGSAAFVMHSLQQLLVRFQHRLDLLPLLERYVHSW